MMQKEGMFRKETEIYAQLFSKWPQKTLTGHPDFKWRPECYYTGSDLIVLEELDPILYKHVPYRVAFDVKHCQEMLRCLAKMHASSIHFEKKVIQEPLNRNFGHLMFEVPMQEGNRWFNAGLELIYFVAVNYSEECYKHVKIPARDEFMRALYNVFQYRDEANEFEKVLAHRDMWSSNIFFKYSAEGVPEHSIMIDFQICNYHSPVMDIMIAMFVTTRRQFREEHLNNCYAFYVDYLSHVLKDVFKFNDEEVDQLKFRKPEEFERIRRHYQFYAHIINCIFVPLIHLRPGTLQELQSKDPQRYFQVCNVNRNEFTKEQMDSDDHYRECVTEVVGELIEYLFCSTSK